MKRHLLSFGRSFCLLSALGLGLVMPGHGLARTPVLHALVIGIDEYDHIGSLSGAVNDARDIADALTEVPGSEVTVLLDGDASRDAILSAWRETVDRAQAGDTLMITYAGHGGHEPEAYPGNEVDGRDETLLLGGFSEIGDTARHRIRDDEIAELIARADPDVTVIFVADSCHSGTVTRSTRNVDGYRCYAGGEIVDDPLPPPPPNTQPDDLIRPNTVFLSAVADDEQAPEFLIGDEVRGALSLAVAEALRGEADTNRDGTLSKGELEGHVRSFVKSVSSGIQNPKVGPVGQNERALISLGTDSVARLEPIAAENPFAAAFDALPELTLWFDGGQWGTAFKGATPAESATRADLIVDLGQRAVFSSIGDRLTSLPASKARADRVIQGIIDKQRVVGKIRSQDHLQPLDVSFQGGNGTYTKGENVVARISGRETEKVWLLHLSSTDEITHLFPLAKFGDPTTTAPTNTLGIPLLVTAPFGADHIIAIEASEDLAALDRLMSDHDGTTGISALWNDLHALLGGREDIAAAVFPFFTTEPPR